MNPDSDIVAAVADSVLERRVVDWARVHGDADGRSRRILVELQRLAVLAAVHRAARDGAPEDRADAPSGVWGHLAVLATLGSGRQGRVFAAWDTQLERPVALKLLRADAAASALIREARLAARVRHPNVATVYGADEIGGRPGIWMEYVAGRTYEQLLADAGPLGADEAALLGVMACRALAAVHAQGVLHRDVKPSNLIREEGGRVVLVDFGSGADRHLDSASLGLSGTPLYFAPECLAGAAATPSSDVYALGVTLFHLLTRAFPVSAAGLDDLRDAHRHGRRRHLRDLRPDLPPPFIAAIERAVAPQAERFPSAGAFERALSQTAFAPAARHGLRSACRLIALVSVLTATTLLRSSATGWSDRPGETAKPFAGWVVVADFQNRTGDRALDGVIDVALSRELGLARAVNILPRERIEDALTLMRRPRSSRIDAALAKELAPRDPDVAALVTGDITRVGARYVFSAQLSRVPSGELLTAAVEISPDLDGAWDAVRRLSSHLLAGLGQSSGSGSERERFARVTTSSLSALRLFTQGLALFDSSDADGPHVLAAMQLFDDAIAADPQFASAYIWRAWCLANAGGSQDAIMAAAAHARDLESNTAEVERLWIEGSYYSLARNGTEAAPRYEALLRLDPTNYWALNNLGFIARGMLRPRPALSVRAAALRPNWFSAQFHAATDALITGDTDGAQRYAGRAAAILRQAGDSLPHSYLHSQLLLLPVYRAWLQKDGVAGVAALDAVRTTLAANNDDVARDIVPQLADLYIGFGQVKVAEQLWAADARTRRRGSDLLQLWAAELRGQHALRAAVEQRLKTSRPTRDLFWFLREIGDRRGTRAAFQDFMVWARPELAASRTLPEFVSMRQAALYASTGRPIQAKKLLEPLLERVLTGQGGPPFEYWALRAGRTLAQVYEDGGEVDRAIDLLETLSRSSWNAVTSLSPYTDEYIRTRWSLASLYRKRHQPDEAVRIEDELRGLLAAADADVEVRRALESRAHRLSTPAVP